MIIETKFDIDEEVNHIPTGTLVTIHRVICMAGNNIGYVVYDKDGDALTCKERHLSKVCKHCGGGICQNKCTSEDITQ